MHLSSRQPWRALKASSRRLFRDRMPSSSFKLGGSLTANGSSSAGRTLFLNIWSNSFIMFSCRFWWSSPSPNAREALTCRWVNLNAKTGMYTFSLCLNPAWSRRGSSFLIQASVSRNAGGSTWLGCVCSTFSHFNFSTSARRILFWAIKAFTRSLRDSFNSFSSSSCRCRSLHLQFLADTRPRIVKKGPVQGADIDLDWTYWYILNAFPGLENVRLSQLLPRIVSRQSHANHILIIPAQCTPSESHRPGTIFTTIGGLGAFKKPTERLQIPTDRRPQTDDKKQRQSMHLYPFQHDNQLVQALTNFLQKVSWTRGLEGKTSARSVRKNSGKIFVGDALKLSIFALSNKDLPKDEACVPFDMILTWCLSNISL